MRILTFIETGKGSQVKLNKVYNMLNAFTAAVFVVGSFGGASTAEPVVVDHTKAYTQDVRANIANDLTKRQYNAEHHALVASHFEVR